MTAIDSSDIKALLEEGFSKIEARIETNANASLAAHEGHRQAFEDVRKGLRRNEQITNKLWSHVHGSEPPAVIPPDPVAMTMTPSGTMRAVVPPTHASMPVPITRQVTENDAEIQAARAELKILSDNFEQKMGKMEAKMEKVDAVHTMALATSKASGAEQNGFAYFRTRDGMKSLIGVVTMVLAAYAAYKHETAPQFTPVTSLPAFASSPSPSLPLSPSPLSPKP